MGRRVSLLLQTQTKERERTSMKFLPALLVVSLLGCGNPLISKPTPYDGKTYYRVKQIEVSKAFHSMPSCTNVSCTVLYAVNVFVHNPLGSDYIKVRCRFFISDYPESTITSKKFLIPSRSTIKMGFSSFLDIPHGGSSRIKVQCGFVD